MSEAAADLQAAAPGPADQIAGLSFAMLLVDPAGAIIDVNPAGEVLMGASASRLIGHDMLGTLHLTQPRLVEGFAAPDAQLVARGVDVETSGRKWRANLTVSALPAFPGWRAVTLSDAGQGERFEEQERRPALRGPAVLAHEIKNPLSAIRGAAQLLARKAGEGERKLTVLIADEVDRIAQLIDRMQRLGREAAEPVAPVNLHQAVRRAMETARLTDNQAVDWREEFDPSLPPVLASEGALVQVLVNLLANARDAALATDAAAVTVRTRFVSGFAMNVMRLGRPLKLPIEIRISDNGPGVDPALRDHIFEPFVSSKANGQGLGLALVQKLGRDMNGRVGHERDEAGGLSHFSVHLPIAREEG